MNKNILLTCLLSFFNYIFLINFYKGEHLIKEVSIFKILIFFSIGIFFNLWHLYAFKRREAAIKYFKIKKNNVNKKVYTCMWMLVPIILYFLNGISYINNNIYLYLKGYIITYFYPWSLIILGTLLFIGNLYFFFWISYFKVTEYICPMFLKISYYRLEVFLVTEILKKNRFHRLEKSKKILKWKLAYYLEKEIYLKRDYREKLLDVCEKILKLPLNSKEIFLVETIYEILDNVYEARDKNCLLQQSYADSKKTDGDMYFYTLEQSSLNNSVAHIVRKYILYKKRSYKEYSKNFLLEIFKVDMDILNKNYNDLDKRIEQALVKYVNISINRENS